VKEGFYFIMPERIAPKTKNLQKFYKSNSDFDILNFDFLNPSSVKGLKGSKEMIQNSLPFLMTFQRLLRIEPNEDIADQLLSRGLTSAHHIASMPRHRFLKQHLDIFEGSVEKALEVHTKAVKIRAKARHLIANIRDITAPHYRNSLFYNIDESLTEYVEEIPSYQDLFGSLDYCECADCSSILGPAAYFLDIMRVTDEYITEPNEGRIPPGYTLEDRRPDLFSEIKLDCADTLTPISYLSLVNSILEAKLASDLTAPPFQELALATFPFNLPVLLPLFKIRTYLEPLDISLYDIYQTMLTSQPSLPGFTDINIAREFLGLSPEELVLITTPDDSPQSLSKMYGFADITKDLPKKGTGKVSISKKSLKVTGEGVNFHDVLQEGQQIQVGEEIRTVVKINSDTELTMDVEWGYDLTSSEYTIYPFYPAVDLTTSTAFGYQTSLAYNQLQNLFTQGLSNKELEAGAANSFFINQPDQNFPYLHLSLDAAGDAENPVTRIKGIYNAGTFAVSYKRLDRISRFVRFSEKTGIDYSTLDWLLTATQSSEITKEFILLLASIKQMSEWTGLTLIEVSSFIHSIKTTGKGNGPNPTDPFDLIFNNAKLLDGENPYKVETPIPFDPARPLSWNVSETPEKPLLKGRVAAATETTINLGAGASTVNDFYNGQAVKVTDGPGKGAYAVIKAYAGAQTTATIYSKFSTLPTDASVYEIVNAKNLVARLSAALQVSSNDLTTLGKYLSKLLALSEGPILLGLDNLTLLYRLAKLPFLFKMPVDEYLCFLSLLFYPKSACDSPPAGTRVNDNLLLKILQAIVFGYRWLETTSFSVYDLGYIISGKDSRYIRLPFSNEDIPPFISELAVMSKGSLLQVGQLEAIVGDPVLATKLYEALSVKGFINSSGVILWNAVNFDEHSAKYPIADTAFTEGSIISEEKSKEIFEILTLQSPPVIDVENKGAESGTLNVYYTSNTVFAYLFINEAEADLKRQHIQKVLNATLEKINFSQLTEFLPILDSAFVSKEIDDTESKNVFDVLGAQDPPLLIIALGGKTAHLSTSYSADENLDFLFDSKGEGQSATIDAYDGTTRIATISPNWPIVPDFFSVYSITRTETNGTVVSATAEMFRLAAGSSTIDGFYDGMLVQITGGKGEGQVRTIIDYNGSTAEATLDAPWSEIPDNASSYLIEEQAAEGTAQAGGANSITLDENASSLNDFYNGMTISIVADSEATLKRDQVRRVLNGTLEKVVKLAAILTDTRVLQENNILNGLSDFFGISSPTVQALIPYSAPFYKVAVIMQDFLSLPVAAVVPPAVIQLINGLSRSNLLAEALNLDISSLVDISRRPDHFEIEDTSKLDLANVQILSAYRSFVREVDDSENKLLQYFDIPFSDECGGNKIAQLNVITGWDPDQICQLVNFFFPAQGEKGISTMQGLLRLVLPFGLIQRAGVNANYLIQAQALSPLSLGPLNGQIIVQNWNRYENVADASQAFLSARFEDADFESLSSSLESRIDEAKRDALMGFTIWHLQKDFSQIREPSDLFNFLLIDVQMSGCDVTSQIAQGITSVQLYMQRARMGLEPGAATDQIPSIWWEWLSTYRLWEVNRKIFLYPENYIEPALRKNSTPQFKELVDQLLQAPPTDATIQSAYLKYFESFRVLANLQQGPAYSNVITELDGDLETDTTYLIGRTNTTPYEYYQRQFVKTTGCQTAAWSPWKEIKISIPSKFVTPVFSLNRLFIFWMEERATKSSIVTQEANGSETQTFNIAEIKFTFQNVDGEWVQQQETGSGLPFLVAKNPNPLATNAVVKSAYNTKQQFWAQPYAQGIARGIPANGTLNFIRNYDSARGTNTDIGRQVAIGDYIWSAGERRRVVDMDIEGQELLFDKKWTVQGNNAPFKVIPRDKDLNVFPPFIGKGKVFVQKGFTVVDGSGTNFLAQVAIGDDIQVGEETRKVTGFETGEQKLVVDKKWTFTTGENGIGTVKTYKGLIQVDGTGTKFLTQLKSGDVITVSGTSRVVDEIESDLSLIVEDSFDKSVSDVPFFINDKASYLIIPRIDGAEKLLVLYGPNLNSATSPPADPTVIKTNDTDDPFIKALNQYNESLNQSLQLGAAARSEKDTGQLTGSPALILGGGMVKTTTRLLSPDYNPALANTSLPVRSNLSRNNDILTVSLNNNYLINSYWSNTTRENPINQNDISGITGRPLLYHVSGAGASLYGVGNQIGSFIFNNIDEAYLINAVDPFLKKTSEAAFMRPYAVINDQEEMILDFGPYTTGNTDFNQMKFEFFRLTTHVAEQLYQRLFIGGLDTLLSLESQMLPELPFDAFYQIPKGTPPPTIDEKHIPSPIMDFEGAYGLYFWEIFFHTVLLIADNYKMSQKFSDAKRWYEYIFDPNGYPRPDDLNPNDRYYRFRPFRHMDIPTMTEILSNQCEINAYNNDPFDPDAIAKLRISAYAKATVIKYIDNIILWADALFSQDTRESIAQATNLYILAQDLLGQKPVNLGECPKSAPLTYNEIKAKYPDGIPEFLIEVENTVFMSGCISKTDYADVPFNDVPFSYFCVPENKELIALWGRIEDRLFKIRHCMNIQGQTRPLALFAPPLDPRSVIQSFGSSGGGFGPASYSPVSVPPYRFSYLIEQAKNLDSQVMNLGGGLLSALQQKDSEALSVLQLNQQTVILNLMTDIKEKQIENLQVGGQAISMSKKSADDRVATYTAWINGGLNAGEVAEIVLSILAVVFESTAIPLNLAGAVTTLAPDVGSPFAMVYGGSAVGSSFARAGTVFDILAKLTQLSADMSGKAGAYERRTQDWQLQKTLAEDDQMQYSYLIEANDIQIAMAERDLQIHLTSIKQNQAQLDFMNRKFTNEQLYAWMTTRLSTTYFQAYSIAINMARQAERSYQYEWNTNNSFINFGYFDSLYKGLTAGEGLMLALSQMETQVVLNNRRELEIEKTISLRELNPIAFLDLIKKGTCLFEFTEELFDRDFPGHYKRKIKTLSISITDKSDKFINLNGSLTQTNNQIVVKPDLVTVRYLLGEDIGTTPEPSSLQTNVNVMQQIAISKGEQNTGLINYDLSDQRYLPFEGTGAVSGWKLSLPLQQNPVDFDLIEDVIIKLQYTAANGGEGFAKSVSQLPALRTRTWVNYIDVLGQYPKDWKNFIDQTPINNSQTLEFEMPDLALPNTQQDGLTGFYLQLRVAEGIKTSSANPYITVKFNDRTEVVLKPSPNNDFVTAFVREIQLKDLSKTLKVSFNLQPGFTPSSLKKEGENALSPAALEDIIIVLFVAGSV
jgi:hypothetical protein